jgi:hypothetical protein
MFIYVCIYYTKIVIVILVSLNRSEAHIDFWTKNSPKKFQNHIEIITQTPGQSG